MNNNFQPIPAVSGTISDIKSMVLKGKEGFTLAETLITLTVIGVVAALTVPSLMTAYKDRQLATAKKKAMSILGNGYKKMMVEEETAFSDLPIFKCGEDFSCLSEIHRKMFNIGADKSKTNDGLPESYLKSTGDGEADFKWEDVPYIFTTTDGMTYGFMAEDGLQTLDIVVDLNGEKAPNKVDKDIFKLRINNQGAATDVSVELDNNPNSCSAKDITKCTTDADVANIFASMSSCSFDSNYKYILLPDDKCLLLTDQDWLGYGGGISAGNYVGSSNTYSYFLINKGDKAGWNNNLDLYTNYCY